MIKENIFAIPSKDRLKTGTLDLLKESGVEVSTSGKRLSIGITDSKLGDFTIAFLRPKDIVRLVATGQIPIGVTGLDLVEEYNLEAEYFNNGARFRPQEEQMKTVQVLLKLGFGRCRLALAAPAESNIKTDQELKESQGLFKSPLAQFDNLTIATSYPRLTADEFLGFNDCADGNDIKFTIAQLDGSVEAAPALGIADTICDLVETGKSLEENGLKEITTILESEAVLITNYSNRKGSDRFVDGLRDRLFITLLRKNNPNAIKKMEEYDNYVKSSLESILRYR